MIIDISRPPKIYIKQKMSKDLTTFIFDLSRKTHNFAKTYEVKSPIE